MVAQPTSSLQWVLLSYRVPREPSTPRIAIWRRLRKHGALQVGDGLVALPADARTKEHLEWVASMVLEADGEAIVWLATTTKRQNAALAERMNAERDGEYVKLIADIRERGVAADVRQVNRLRREWRRIDRRDYFRSPEREPARQAIRSLDLAGSETDTEPSAGNGADR